MTTFKFNSLNSAQLFCNQASRIMQIVMGDNNQFWVCTPGDAVKLERRGYEVLDRQSFS